MNPTVVGAASVKADLLLEAVAEVDRQESAVRTWKEMWMLAMAMVVKRDATIGSQKRQLAALRDELRRYTAIQVKGKQTDVHSFRAP